MLLKYFFCMNMVLPVAPLKYPIASTLLNEVAAETVVLQENCRRQDKAVVLGSAEHKS